MIRPMLALIVAGPLGAQVEVSGSVRMFGDTAPRSVTVSLTAVPPATGRVSGPAKDGDFLLQGVSPGEYDLGIVSLGRPLFLERSQRGEVSVATTLRVTIPAAGPSFRLATIRAHDMGALLAPAREDAARCLSMRAGRKPELQANRVPTSFILTQEGSWHATWFATPGSLLGALICVTEERDEVGRYVTTTGRDAGKAVAYHWDVRLLRPDGRILTTRIDAPPPEEISVRTNRRGDVVKRLDSPRFARFDLRTQVERWLAAAAR